MNETLWIETNTCWFIEYKKDSVDSNSSVNRSEMMQTVVVCSFISLMATLITVVEANPLHNETAATCSARYESCSDSRPCCADLNCVDPSTIREDLPTGKVALNGGVPDLEDMNDVLTYSGALDSDYEDFPPDSGLETDEATDENLNSCVGDDCAYDDYVAEESDSAPGICVPAKTDK